MIPTTKHNLWDKLALMFTEFNHASIEEDILDLQETVPEALRTIVKHIQETEPDAVNTISLFEDCANDLEGMEIKPIEETYWETRKRLNIT